MKFPPRQQLKPPVNKLRRSNRISPAASLFRTVETLFVNYWVMLNYNTTIVYHDYALLRLR